MDAKHQWAASIAQADKETAQQQAAAANINGGQYNAKSPYDEAYRQALRRPDRMLQYFAYAHLPAHLQAVSEPFWTLAHLIVETLPENPERTVALRKLLEAKDCAVRAVLFKG